MISIIMPYWNRQAAADIGIASLVKFSKDVEIVVVDDGSGFIAKHPVTLVSLPKKDHALNPCVPINAGVKAASGDVIVLTNPEIIHKKFILIEMLCSLRTLGDDGYVMAAAFCPESRSWHCHSSMSGMTVSGVRHPKGSGLHFCAMLNRSLWDKTGFDESYRDGAGYEDNDFVMRLGQAVAKFLIRDDLVVLHPKTGATTKWSEGAHGRNEALFRSKWLRKMEVAA